MAKFRSGVAPLLIETGRYSNTPEAERVCFNCPNDIENELHVLLRCPIYNDLRDEMFVTAAHVCYDFNEMSENEKLCFLLSDGTIANEVAKTLHNMLVKRRNILYVQ